MRLNPLLPPGIYYPEVCRGPQPAFMTSCFLSRAFHYVNEAYFEHMQMNRMRRMRRTSPAMMPIIMISCFSAFHQSRSKYSHLDPTKPCSHLRQRRERCQKVFCFGFFFISQSSFIITCPPLTCRMAFYALGGNDSPRGHSSRSAPRDIVRSGHATGPSPRSLLEK